MCFESLLLEMAPQYSELLYDVGPHHRALVYQAASRRMAGLPPAVR